MKIYSEIVSFQSKNTREILDFTTRIKAAVEKSGLREGIVLVSSQHSNTGLIVTEYASGLLNDLESWLEGLTALRDSYNSKGQTAMEAIGRCGSLFLPRQAFVPLTESRLDLGPTQAVLFVELDGLRPRRITLKILGE